MKDQKVVRVLITGASGFIGTNLLKKALTKYKVVTLSRKNIEYSHFNLTQIKISELSSKIDIKKPLEKVDVVIHLSCSFNPSQKNSLKKQKFLMNFDLLAAKNIAEQAINANVKRFIYISSIKVNGEVTDRIKISHNDIPNPCNLYGEAKYKIELKLEEIVRKSKMDLVIIRPPLVYGPGVKGNFNKLISLIHKVPILPIGSVRNYRSFINIDNISDLIFTCIDHPKAANQIFLASDDHDVSTIELVTKISKLIGSNLKIIPFPHFILKNILIFFGFRDVHQKFFSSLSIDISKTKKLLNWSPPVTFDEGLKNTAGDYLRKNNT